MAAKWRRRRGTSWLRTALVVVAFLTGGRQAGAQTPGEPPFVRLDELRHGSVDRLVVWLPADKLTVHQEGDALLIAFPAAMQPRMPTQASRDTTGSGVFGQWVKDIAVSPGFARISLAAGAHPRIRPWSNRIWIDVDGTTPKLSGSQFWPTRSATESKQAAYSRPMPPPALAVTISPAPQAATIASPPSATALPPSSPLGWSMTMQVDASAPASPVTRLPDQANDGPSILLPLGQAAAASFTRGGQLYVVFDTAQPLDLGPLKDDAVFGGAVERLLPDGAELRLRQPQGVQPRLSRRGNSWILTLGSARSLAAPVIGRAAHGVLTLLASAPGHVVAVEDEATGDRLLVGTQHEPGQRMPAGHRSGEAVLLPSWQGVVVLPHADRVRMRDVEAGFEVSAAEAPALAIAWPDGALALRSDGQAMTRRFDLPGLPMPILRQRLAEALRDTAETPRSARTAPRLRVAQAMLAAGLDVEASSVLRVAEADDPTATRNPGLRGLTAIAGWLSARAGGGQAAAPALDAAGLGDSDEALLWRALWSGNADPVGAASMLASRWQLLLNYPENLRRPMLPAAADLLATGGQEAALSQLLAAFPGAALDLARAAQLSRQGHADESLHILDRMAAGSDRLLRSRAMEAAVEQRLAAGTLTPEAAATLLDRQLYTWRESARELRLRLRAAELRAKSGNWRLALSQLCEADPLFPTAHDRIHAAEISVLSDVLHDERAAKLNALDLVALADAASTLLGAADADARLAPLLADRLLSLDLPDKAEPILRRLLDRTADGPARPALGLRLAGLVAERGDAAGALSVLEGSTGTGTPPPPVDQQGAQQQAARAILKARLLAASGRAAEALDVLAGRTSQPAMELTATIHESGKDWLGAERDLASLADGAAFAALPANARRDIVLRAVRDASEAGDMAGLRRWRATSAPLFADAPNSALFAVLTAEPVKRVSDLSRSGKELGDIQGLPASLVIASTHL